ncbi:2533_t:CDS:2, partial [Dentiscutata erythropus]
MMLKKRCQERVVSEKNGVWKEWCLERVVLGERKSGVGKGGVRENWCLERGMVSGKSDVRKGLPVEKRLLLGDCVEKEFVKEL